MSGLGAWVRLGALNGAVGMALLDHLSGDSIGKRERRRVWSRCLRAGLVALLGLMVWLGMPGMPSAVVIAAPQLSSPPLFSLQLFSLQGGSNPQRWGAQGIIAQAE